jgi:hypothetical protein
MRKRSHETGLETCLLCGRDFVNPIDWEPADEHHWWILLRCGECETWRETTVEDEIAERFDAELDRRADVLAGTLHKLDAERMGAWVDSFVLALRSGLVDAADFAR